MSKLSNIILRNHQNSNDTLPTSPNKPDYSNTNLQEEKLQISNSTLINSNPHIISSQAKTKTIILSSYSEVIPENKPLILQQDSSLSQTFTPNKRYDYGNTPIKRSSIPLSNSLSFCYPNEPRGGIISLNSSANKTTTNNVLTTFKSRTKIRSKTEMNGRKRDTSIRAKTIHDDMRAVWLKEVSISTEDSFQLDSVSNELVLPKKDWIYLEVIDNEISFHCKTFHTINEYMAKQRKVNNMDLSIISPLKEKETKMDFNLHIDSFNNEILGIEGVNKPSMIKTKTILKTAPHQFKSANQHNNDKDYISHFNINIINRTHKERWNYTNEINNNKKISLNLPIDNNNSNNESNSINNSYDQYYFIHERNNTIISKILISSSEMSINAQYSNLFTRKNNQNGTSFLVTETPDTFSLLPPSRKTLITQSQRELNNQILSPHFTKSDSFSIYSIYPMKKWDPVLMRKENQERIDYIIQKSILLRSSGNRHITELYKMEYDEIVEDEKAKPIKVETRDHIMQSVVSEEKIYGIELYAKWNENNSIKDMEYFTIVNKNSKWTSQNLYPIQSASFSIKHNNNEHQVTKNNIINQSNSQQINYIITDNANFTFDSEQRSLYHNKEKSYGINKCDLSDEANTMAIQLKKEKTFQIKTNEYFNYVNNEIQDTEGEREKCPIKKLEDEEILSIMKNRWNSFNNCYQSINYNLIQFPITSLFQFENDKLEIIQKGKVNKNHRMIPYQAINFHLDGLFHYLDYSNENQMEFILKNQHKKEKEEEKKKPIISILNQSEPIVIEYISAKKKKKAKAKKPQATDLKAKETSLVDNDQKQNDENEENLRVPETNENQQKTEEDDNNPQIKNKDRKNLHIKENNQVLKRKKRNIIENKNQCNYQYEKNKSLPAYTIKKKNNDLFSVVFPNYGDTSISKQKEKKKPLPVKATTHDFEIYTKDQGIQRIKTNNIK